LAFPGLDTVPGYALFGAYGVKWIGVFNRSNTIVFFPEEDFRIIDKLINMVAERHLQDFGGQ